MLSLFLYEYRYQTAISIFEGYLYRWLPRTLSTVLKQVSPIILILHSSTFKAAKPQKADEGITIDVEQLTYELVREKITLSGEKYFYFSTKVIDSEPLPSLEEMSKSIKKVGS